MSEEYQGYICQLANKKQIATAQSPNPHPDFGTTQAPSSPGTLLLIPIKRLTLANASCLDPQGLLSACLHQSSETQFCLLQPQIEGQVSLVVNGPPATTDCLLSVNDLGITVRRTELT